MSSLLSWPNSTTGVGDPIAHGTTTDGRRSLPPPCSPTLRPCVASAAVWRSSRSSRLGARDEEELDVLLEMAPPLNAIHSYSSPQLQATLERSAYLAEKLSRPRDSMSCLVGLCAVRFVQGHVTDAYELATRALDLAEAEPKTAGQAHMVMAGSLTSLGRLEEAIDHFERSRELSRGSVSLIIGTLPEVHGLAWSAHAHWMLGNREQAIVRCREAVEIAKSADHPYSLAVALGYSATTHQLVHDRTGAAEAANELISLCERYSFSFYGQWGWWSTAGCWAVRPASFASSRASTSFGRRARTLACRTGCTCWRT